MTWLVVVDFDGTITKRDTQDDLLEKYAPEAYVEAERGLETHHVTEAEVVYVGVDPTTPERKPTPLLPG